MKKSQVVRRTHRTNPLSHRPTNLINSNGIQSDSNVIVGCDNVMLPDFFSRRVVHLLDGFVGHVIIVLVTREIEYFHRLVFDSPIAILDHQSLYAGSDCNKTKRAIYIINDSIQDNKYENVFFSKTKTRSSSSAATFLSWDSRITS